MASWVSQRGKLYPANEKCVLTNMSTKKFKWKDDVIEPGESFIYEGPDRAAMQELYDIDPSGKTTYLGQDYKQDVNLRSRIRQLHNQSTEEYMEVIGFDEVKDEKEFKKRAVVLNKHEIPKLLNKLSMIQQDGGGIDTSGSGEDRYGNFGLPAEMK